MSSMTAELDDTISFVLPESVGNRIPKYTLARARWDTRKGFNGHEFLRRKEKPTIATDPQ
jgi:hypothetical protein